MPGLNIFLVLLLIVTQECAESGYSLLSATHAALVFGAALGALALLGACRGLVRLLGRGLDREGSAAWSSAAAHSLIAVLLLLDFYPDPAAWVERLPFVTARATSTYGVLAGLSLAAALGLAPTLRNLPTRAVSGFFSFALAGALAVSTVDAALQRPFHPKHPAQSEHPAHTGQATHGGEAAPDLPNVYYIVLDSHASLRAIPPGTPGADALRQRVRSDFERSGIELHELAYARYQWTHESLHSILDNSPEPGPEDKQHGVITLPPNKLFDQLIGQGYRPILHHSNYIDVCEAARAGAPRCEVYPVNNLGDPLPASQQYPLLAASMLERIAGGAPLAQKSRTFGTINSVRAFERMIKEVPRHRSGAFVFGHFMLPHEPFILDEWCHTEVGEVWRKPYQEYYSPISPAQAARQWAEYVPQAACTHALIMRLVEALQQAGLYEQTTLILHGDHGARIRTTLASGHEKPGQPLGQRTYLDFLATLFAIKPGDIALAPGSQAGRTEWATVDNLLAERMGWPQSPVKRPRARSAGPR